MKSTKPAIKKKPKSKTKKAFSKRRTSVSPKARKSGMSY